MYTVILFIIVTFLLIIIGKLSRHSGFSIEPFGLPREYTNILRGLAMIMIMYGHICGRYHESVWFSPLACTGVALFLFLSGYGNNESFLKNNSFPFTKILKIVIPYWIVLFITTLVTYKNFSLESFLLDITFIRTSYWFVGYILIWYFVYWLAVNFFYSYRWGLFSIISIFSFVFLSPLESEQSLSFILGVYVSENKAEIFRFSEKKLMILSTLFFVLATVFLATKQLSMVRNNDFMMRLNQLLIKLPYALSMIIGLRHISWVKNNKALLIIASITYELYLCHMPLLNIIQPPLSIYKTPICTLGLVFASFVLANILSLVSKIVFGKLN